MVHDNTLLEAIAAACERVGAIHQQGTGRWSELLTLAKELRNVTAPAADPTSSAGEPPPMPERVMSPSGFVTVAVSDCNAALDCAEWWRARAEQLQEQVTIRGAGLDVVVRRESELLAKLRSRAEKAEARMKELEDEAQRLSVDVAEQQGAWLTQHKKWQQLKDEVDAAWKATGPVPVRGLVSLAEVVGDQRAKRDELRERAEKAEANYQFMVDKAADAKLDGYRELGARAAKAENERDDAVGRITELEAQLKQRGEELQLAISCGEENVCGTVGEQCQKCLRMMFHREVARGDQLREREQQAEAEAALPECVREWRGTLVGWRSRVLDRIRHDVAAETVAAHRCLEWLATAPAEQAARIGLRGDAAEVVRGWQSLDDASDKSIDDVLRVLEKADVYDVNDLVPLLHELKTWRGVPPIAKAFTALMAKPEWKKLVEEK